MSVSRVIAIFAIAVSLGAGEARAQALSSNPVPAEFPPSSYKGRQYVDSRGCIFIRAGIDGNVTWVPRVSRSRKMVCGFQPSIAQKAPASKPAAKVAAAPAKPAKVIAPKKVAVAKPAAAKKKVAVKKVSTVAVAKPKPVKTVVPKAAPVAKPAPTRVVSIAPAPEPAKVAKVVKQPAKAKKKPAKLVRARTPRKPACEGFSALSGTYLQGRPGVNVRCGPQTTPHVFFTQGGRTVRVTQISPSLAPASAVTGQAPVAQPARTGQKQTRMVQAIYVPEGYKLAWDDDRLNTRRGQRTLAGDAQMELIWSSTVPRYLIDKNSGRDVSYKFPGLMYPYTSFEAQSDAGVVISTQGKMVPEPIRVVRVSQNTRPAKKAVRKQKPKPVATLSTRSSVPGKTVKAASHRYVQVGVFTVPSNAKKTAQRIANTGLPARMGKVKSRGKTYTMVVAGPFKTQPELQAALAKVRRVGFRDAVLRK